MHTALGELGVHDRCSVVTTFEPAESLPWDEVRRENQTVDYSMAPLHMLINTVYLETDGISDSVLSRELSVVSGASSDSRLPGLTVPTKPRSYVGQSDRRPQLLTQARQTAHTAHA